MTNAELADMSQAVATAAAAWLRRGVPFPREDLEQEGYRIALESMPAARRSGAPLVPYICGAVINSLGRSIAAWSAVTTVPKHRRPMPSATNPANLRIPVDETTSCLRESPEAVAISADWNRRVGVELGRLMDGMTAVDRRIVGHLMATGDAPAVATKAVGVSAPRIYKARKKLVERARRDERLRAVVGESL